MEHFKLEELDKPNKPKPLNNNHPPHRHRDNNLENKFLFLIRFRTISNCTSLSGAKFFSALLRIIFHILNLICHLSKLYGIILIVYRSFFFFFFGMYSCRRGYYFLYISADFVT